MNKIKSYKTKNKKLNNYISIISILCVSDRFKKLSSIREYYRDYNLRKKQIKFKRILKKILKKRLVFFSVLYIFLIRRLVLLYNINLKRKKKKNFYNRICSKYFKIFLKYLSVYKFKKKKKQFFFRDFDFSPIVKTINKKKKSKKYMLKLKKKKELKIKKKKAFRTYIKKHKIQKKQWKVKSLNFIDFYFIKDIFKFKKIYLRGFINLKSKFINYKKKFKNKKLNSLNFLTVEVLKIFSYKMLFFLFFDIRKDFKSRPKFIKYKNIKKFIRNHTLNSRLLKKYLKLSLRKGLRKFKKKYKKMTKFVTFRNNLRSLELNRGYFFKNVDYFLFGKYTKFSLRKKIFLLSTGRYVMYKFNNNLGCSIPFKYTKFIKLKKNKKMSKFFSYYSKIHKKAKEKITNFIKNTEFKNVINSDNFYIRNPNQKLIISGKKKLGINLFNNLFLAFNKIFKAPEKKQTEVVNRIFKKLFIRGAIKSGERTNTGFGVKQTCYVLMGFEELKSRVNLFFLDIFNNLCRKKDKTFRTKKLKDLLVSEFLNLSFLNTKKRNKTQIHKLYLEITNFMFKEFKYRGLFKEFRHRTLFTIRRRRTKFNFILKKKKYKKYLKRKKIRLFKFKKKFGFKKGYKKQKKNRFNYRRMSRATNTYIYTLLKKILGIRKKKLLKLRKSILLFKTIPMFEFDKKASFDRNFNIINKLKKRFVRYITKNFQFKIKKKKQKILKKIPNYFMSKDSYLHKYFVLYIHKKKKGLRKGKKILQKSKFDYNSYLTMYNAIRKYRFMRFFFIKFRTKANILFNLKFKEYITKSRINKLGLDTNFNWMQIFKNYIIFRKDADIRNLCKILLFCKFRLKLSLFFNCS